MVRFKWQFWFILAISNEKNREISGIYTIFFNTVNCFVVHFNVSILQPFIEPEHQRKMALIGTNCTHLMSFLVFAFPFQFISLHYHFHFDFDFICGFATPPTTCIWQIRLHLKIDFKPLQCQPSGRKAPTKKTYNSCLRSRLFRNWNWCRQIGWAGWLNWDRCTLHTPNNSIKPCPNWILTILVNSQTKLNLVETERNHHYRQTRKRKSKQFIFHRFSAMPYDWMRVRDMPMKSIKCVIDCKMIFSQK